MAGHGKCGEARPGAVTDLPEESDGEVSGFEEIGRRRAARRRRPHDGTSARPASARAWRGLWIGE
eukprot:15347971-Alexandrium_andersonii.AAC.1